LYFRKSRVSKAGAKSWMVCYSTPNTERCGQWAGIIFVIMVRYKKCSINNKEMQNKKYYSVLGIIVLIILLIIVSVWVKHKGLKPADDKPAPSTQTGPGDTSKTPSVTPLTTKTVATALPVNFPVEARAEVLQSSEITDPATKTVKILRTTTTSKTLDEALKVYKEYLTKNGWTLGETTDVATLKVLTGTKGDAQIKITISYEGVSKSNAVAVNYTTPQ
jgi:hypothetical protein